MRYTATTLTIAFVFMVLLVPTDGGPVQSAQAQDPLPIGAGTDTGIFIIGVQEKGFETLEENGRAVFPVRFVDVSIESAQLYTTQIPISCSVEDTSENIRGWSYGFELPGTIGRNMEKTINVEIKASIASSPMYFSIGMVCTAGGPLNGEVIGEFNFTAKLDVYQRFSLQPFGTPPRVNPDDDIQLTVSLSNRGNDMERFVGRVEGPPGFQFEHPPAVLVGPGETEVVEINGVTPRDKIWYRQQMVPIEVTYWPESDPDGEQTRTIGATMGGLYFHPALIPLIILTAAAIVVLAMIVAYARRTVEEQVLGKPVPPWRIPVEREYLKRLEMEDPDEFYIVRYHLMVEEHQSALLWYKHFKHATRKDRKLERKWLKKTEKVKGKSERLRSKQTRLENRMARRLRVLPTARRRRLAVLDKRNLDAQWKEQRRLLKVHEKAVKRIDKIHSASEKKEKKRVMAGFEKERKRAEKENKKRIKQGEDPLPLPEEPALEARDREFPEPVEVPLQSVEDSRFAVKAERTSRRFNKRIARRSKKAKHRMRKKGAKRDEKIGRLKSHIPQKPAGALYQEDEFIPEEEVVVEDSRTRIQRALGIPTMQTRDALRRRRMVYKVKIRQAKKADDLEQVQRLKREYVQERARLLSMEKAEDGPETSDSGGGKEGGPMGRLVRRRRPESAGSEGGDASNQVSKEEPPPSQGDRSSRGDRSAED